MAWERGAPWKYPVSVPPLDRYLTEISRPAAIGGRQFDRRRLRAEAA